MRTLDLQAGNADWGLQRISQKGKLSRNDPTVTNYDYSYKQPDGAGACSDRAPNSVPLHT